MNCIFCKIINNEIPSYIIYEDDDVKVFLDIHPNANGHMLVIPKQHYVDIVDIDLAALQYINNINKKMYKLLQDKLHIDGLTIAQNNGIAQDVKHYHVHLIPRYSKENKYYTSLPIEEVHKLLIS